MESIIAHAPAFTTLELAFTAGESVSVQPGAMIAMTTGFDLKVGVGSQMGTGGSVGRGLRSLVSGENVFTAIYTAKRDGERLTLAPAQMGEIRALQVGDGIRHFISRGAYLASTSGVQISVHYAGIKGLLATRGLFLMRTEGSGQVFVCSHGALVEKVLAEGERFVLDNRHIVSFSESLRYEMVKVAGSLRHSYLSGEGLVNRYTGPGQLLYQTRGQAGGGILRGMLDIAT